MGQKRFLILAIPNYLSHDCNLELLSGVFDIFIAYFIYALQHNIKRRLFIFIFCHQSLLPILHLFDNISGHTKAKTFTCKMQRGIAFFIFHSKFEECSFDQKGNSLYLTIITCPMESILSLEILDEHALFIFWK